MVLRAEHGFYSAPMSDEANIVEDTDTRSHCVRFPGLVAVMPALNEEASIGPVISGLLQQGVAHVIVGDNGSTDATAAVAREAGAQVVAVTQRGYGSACLGALAALPEDTRAVVFCDADGADDLASLPALCEPVLNDEVDLHVGSRALGQAERGALTFPQRVGNIFCTFLMRWLYRERVTDLGPFRCVSQAALTKMQMCDPNFGWTAEMQVKVFRLGLRYSEMPVDAKCRTAGTSKISGNLWAGNESR